MRASTSTWPGPMLPGASPVSWATFDGKDKIELRENWFLIHGGDGEFFLEHATNTLDISAAKISMSLSRRLIKASPTY